VIAFVFVAPQGIVGLFRKIGRKIATVVPKPIEADATPSTYEPVHEPSGTAIHEGE
jgi:hypothetical protein